MRRIEGCGRDDRNGDQAALRRLLQGRTAIIIAHRSTVRADDCLFLMRDHGIAERGTHDELMALDGVYGDLYQRQTGPDQPAG